MQRVLFGYGYWGEFTPLKMGADWEFQDGTPAPRTAGDSHSDRQLRAYTENIIEACATVEEMAEKNQLPLRPGTDMIRKFDPEVPLFLPINDVIMDAETSTEQKYEIYQEMAPYMSEEVASRPTTEVAGDGSPIDSADMPEVSNKKTSKKRRRKVTMVKQSIRHLQPSTRQTGPFTPHDEGGFNVGHGTGA